MRDGLDSGILLASFTFIKHNKQVNKELDILVPN